MPPASKTSGVPEQSASYQHCQGKSSATLLRLWLGQIPAHFFYPSSRSQAKASNPCSPKDCRRWGLPQLRQSMPLHPPAVIHSGMNLLQTGWCVKKTGCCRDHREQCIDAMQLPSLLPYAIRMLGFEQKQQVKGLTVEREACKSLWTL